jgi:5-methylthioribose kinase
VSSVTDAGSSVRLTPETTPEYLRDRDEIRSAVADVIPLGGGVSNTVIRVETEETCLVCKQPYPNLDVAEDWPANVARVHNEARATEAYAAIIERVGIEGVSVPRVLFEDREEHVIGIECIPASAMNWKTVLLDGRVDRNVARSLGELLGAVHRIAAEDEALRKAFSDPTPFEQLRLDPYHRTVARRHPDLTSEIRTEIDRIESVRQTLIHGDYSPKNVLVGDGGGTIWVLDFEVAHWGDPAFDVAFMCNHLLLKSLHNPADGTTYVEAIDAFRSAYDRETPWDREREVAAELGILLLARVDGKSPVEYLNEEAAAAARSVGRAVIRDGVETIADVLTLAAEERDRL